MYLFDHDDAFEKGARNTSINDRTGKLTMYAVVCTGDGESLGCGGSICRTLPEAIKLAAECNRDAEEVGQVGHHYQPITIGLDAQVASMMFREAPDEA